MSESNSHHAIPSIKYYVITFFSLLVLTGLTVYTALYVNIEGFNLIIAMFIASIKAFLVLSFFMGLWWDSGINRLVVFASLFFIFIFLSITWLDFANRDLVNPSEAEVINTFTPVEVQDFPTLPEVDEVIKKD